jgi:membrane-associated PAP2 superfamily phosphatase
MNRTGLVIALAVAAVVGLVFGLKPDLDLKLAAPFFDPARGGFWRSFDPTYLRLRDASTWLVALIAAPAVLALVVKLIRPRRPLIVPGRAIVLMLVTLALAPGVVANLILKEHWGRPRPIDVAEFGGDEHFRPWWDPRGDCAKNCSFVAGEPSGAFWTLAPAAVVPPHWRALAYGGALVFGAAVGVLRMAAGAHFFSDVVFAGVFTFLVIWLTHGWLYRWPRTRIADATVERALERLRGEPQQPSGGR